MALSELGLMYPIMVRWGQAKVIKLFILMDVDTQTHTTTRTCAPAPPPSFLPLLPHTSPDSKAHKHTSWPGGQWGRKSIFEELELPGLVVEIRLSLWANYRVCYNAALSLARSECSCRFWHIITFACSVTVGSEPALLFRRTVNSYGNVRKTQESGMRFLTPDSLFHMNRFIFTSRNYIQLYQSGHLFSPPKNTCGYVSKIKFITFIELFFKNPSTAAAEVPLLTVFNHCKSLKHRL